MHLTEWLVMTRSTDVACNTKASSPTQHPIRSKQHTKENRCYAIQTEYQQVQVVNRSANWQQRSFKPWQTRITLCRIQVRLSPLRTSNIVSVVAVSFAVPAHFALPPCSGRRNAYDSLRRSKPSASFSNSADGGSSSSFFDFFSQAGAGRAESPFDEEFEQPDPEHVFGNVFEEMLRPEVILS